MLKKKREREGKRAGVREKKGNKWCTTLMVATKVASIPTTVTATKENLVNLCVNLECWRSKHIRVLFFVFCSPTKAYICRIMRQHQNRWIHSSGEKKAYNLIYVPIRISGCINQEKKGRKKKTKSGNSSTQHNVIENVLHTNWIRPNDTNLHRHVHTHVYVRVLACLQVFVWLSMQCSTNMSMMWYCTYVAMQYVAVAFFKRNQFTLHTSAISKGDEKNSRLYVWSYCITVMVLHRHQYQDQHRCFNVGKDVLGLYRESEQNRIFRYVIHIRLMCFYIFSLFIQTQMPLN